MSLLTLILVIASIAPARAQSTDERLRMLERQLEMLQNEIKTLRTEREVEKKREAEAAQKQAEATRKAEEADRKTNVLAETVDQLRDAFTIPEEIKLEGGYGLGPAASKVYGARGLSIGGYGEVIFKKPVSDKDDLDALADAQRLILYVGYKFNDWIVFNSEFEFEHATTDEGEAEVEFSYLDFFFRDYANARAGLMLIPMGIINEVHEPVFFYGVDRPEVDLRIIPTTWREVGAGMFGDITDDLQYRVYGVNGFKATGFRASGVRGGRQEGALAIANDWAFVGRVDYKPLLNLMVGTSVWAGDSGQGQVIDGVGIPATPTTIWELHGQWRYRGFEARTEYAMAWIGNARTLTLALQEIGEIPPTEVIANQMLGMYAEGAYDVMPWFLPETEQALLPFGRFEYVNTQLDVPSGFTPDNFFQDRIWTFGVNYKPIPQVVLKLDYRIFNPVSGEKPDFIDVGLGFVF